MQIDPAEVRFTQDSIALYFQPPHEYFSIRTAVRRISKNKMKPEHFPPIRIIQYGGFYWSIDNRRLWVFRYARCSSILTVKLHKMHHRLEELIENSDLLSMMEEADFFPRVRDRGEKDWKFDVDFPQPSSACGLRFPQPSSSLHKSRNDWFMKSPITRGAPNDKAEEHYSTKSPSGAPNDKPKEHYSTRSPGGAPYDEEREHTKEESETETPSAGVIRKIFGYLKSLLFA